MIQGAQALGFVIGPGIQAAFSPIGCSAFASTGKPYFSLDTYTSCGWCTAFFGLITLLIFSIPNVFVEHNVADIEITAIANGINGKAEGTFYTSSDENQRTF